MKNLIIVTAFLALAACGGGGSDSGGGVANGEPGPTPYAGLYRGQLRVTVGNDADGVSGVENVEVKIGEDGRMGIRLTRPLPQLACTALPPPTYINGNQIDLSISQTCFSPELGNCTINTTGSATANGQSIIGSSPGTGECASGFKFNIRYELGVNKV